MTNNVNAADTNPETGRPCDLGGLTGWPDDHDDDYYYGTSDTPTALDSYTCLDYLARCDSQPTRV